VEGKEGVRKWNSSDVAVGGSFAGVPNWARVCRHACYGSGTTSFPAVLPLLVCMPPELLGGPAPVLPQILDSLWTGWEAAAGQLPARAAAASSFLECLQWGVSMVYLAWPYRDWFLVRHSNCTAVVLECCVVLLILLYVCCTGVLLRCPTACAQGLGMWPKHCSRLYCIVLMYFSCRSMQLRSAQGIGLNISIFL
jgi:hypothetical protein